MSMVYSNDKSACVKPARNVIFKGWILILQDGCSSANSALKWLPKFAVVNKFEKTILLYDYEVSNETVASSFTNSKPQSNSQFTDQVHFSQSLKILKMDNSVKRENFIQYWRNKSENFENEFSKYMSDGFTKSTSISNRLSHIFHMSSKDSETSIDRDHDFNNSNCENIENNNERSQNLTTSATPFRFAGLFFKKDKTEKAKHSSLKRAKSGIQLERKKNSLANNVNMTMNDRKRSNGYGDYNDFENKLNLPSPMRPSRSHESLASPLKPTTNQEQPTQFTKSTSIKSKLKLLGTQTPSTKSIRANSNTTAAKKSFQNNKETILKLNLNSSPDTHPVVIHSIHTSLFNEENCLEIKSLNSTISVTSTAAVESSSFETDFSDEDDYTDYDYVTDDYQQKQYRHGRHRNNVKSDRVQSTPKCSMSSEVYSSRYFLCRNTEEREKWIQALKSVVESNVNGETRHAENSLQVWLLEAKGQAISSKPTKKYFCEVFLNNILYSRTCCRDKKEILFWGENFDFNDVQCEHLRVELYQETAERTKKKPKKDKENLNSTSSIYVHSHLSNQTLLGYVNIPVSSIEGSQPVEKWYRLEPPSSLPSITNQVSEDLAHFSHGNSVDSLTNSLSTQQNAASIASLTTQNFSKDSISIRIKGKYQSVDILPLACYNRIIDYVRSKNLDLMLTLEPQLNVRVKDDLANSLVRIAHKLKIQTTFLSDLVLAEILQLEDSSLTFRGNSLATKAMESYMKLVGEVYLKQTLSDCVRSIIDTTHDLEIDPSKVTNQSSLQANREELVQILHLVCGRVFNSCINFPVEMKQVFTKLREKCKENGKTDEMCDTLISASIFLRFICPAILSPNLFNLTQEYPQEKAARKLTLAAKTLQTIANFSKFGGKEFYMSFDKMNKFVEEHTVLMREFLRNISTLTEEEKLEINQSNQTAKITNVLPIVTLTPQTPDTPHRTSTKNNLVDSEFNNQSIDFNLSIPDEETNFEPELIDLGKQLSILHSLLVTILASIDESKMKFSDDLPDILDEITELKKNMDFTNLPVISNSTNTHPNKLYSYENRLHSVMKNQLSLNSPTSPPLETNDNHIYPSHQFVNGESKLTSASLTQQKLESEINSLRNKLRDTEISLKKEQTEKYLIEYKLKQQQQDNDLQMRSIINRLIKVEEELRKEQTEMHKLLKAKQDLIDIQKKRIEHLTNRGGLGSTVNMNGTSNKSLNSIQIQNIKASNNSNNNLQKNVLQNLNNLVDANKSGQYSEDQSKDAWVPSLKPPADNNLILPTQVAASPSSSSSSMTQFCKYLASNTLIDHPAADELNDQHHNFQQNHQRKSFIQTNLDELSHCNPRMLSPTPPPAQVDAASSSTSSSSSALSTSSSLNHLNHNHQPGNFSYFRASEL